MSKKIKVARLRNTPYEVNYVSEGMRRVYIWQGSRNGITDIKEIPEEVVNYLLISSSCFQKGKLKIIDESKKAQEFVNNMPEKNNYENNTHSREEIINILNSKTQDMKKSLQEINNEDEKKFVCDVAKEIKLDSSTKRRFLAKWLGIDEEILFDEE